MCWTVPRGLTPEEPGPVPGDDREPTEATAGEGSRARSQREHGTAPRGGSVASSPKGNQVKRPCPPPPAPGHLGVQTHPPGGRELGQVTAGPGLGLPHPEEPHPHTELSPWAWGDTHLWDHPLDLQLESQAARRPQPCLSSRADGTRAVTREAAPAHQQGRAVTVIGRSPFRWH